MYARPILRTALRRSVAPSCRVATRASLSTTVRRQTSPTETLRDRHVSVTSFEGGKTTQEQLQVSEDNKPVPPPGGDSESVAVPLDPAVTEQLTPTMAKFTLHGKVAVVTG